MSRGRRLVNARRKPNPRADRLPRPYDRHVWFWSVVAVAWVVAVPGFLVVAPPELRAFEARIEQTDPAQFADVMRLVGLRDDGPRIQIILAADDSELGRNTPAWIVGFADGAASTIVLFPTRSPSYPYDSLDDVLRHEVAHVLIARAAPGALIPRWFHEGLAMAVERRWGIADHTRVAIAAFGTERVSQLDREFGESAETAARAYGLSGAFVRDLLGRYGSEFPATLLARLAAGVPFEQAFIASTGVTLTDAERAFWRSRWWYQVVPFVTSSLVMWGGIVLLSVWAMKRRAAHSAEWRRRWDEEEAIIAAESATERPPKNPDEWSDPEASLR